MVTLCPWPLTFYLRQKFLLLSSTGTIFLHFSPQAMDHPPSYDPFNPFFAISLLYLQCKALRDLLTHSKSSVVVLLAILYYTHQIEQNSASFHRFKLDAMAELFVNRMPFSRYLFWVSVYFPGFTGQWISLCQSCWGVISKDLKEGGSLGLSLGCLFAFLQRLTYVIQMMKGLTNAFRTVVLYLKGLEL